MENLINLEIIQITTVEGKLQALLSYQNPDANDINDGYDTIIIPINIREIQRSVRDNMLVNQSVKNETVASITE